MTRNTTEELYIAGVGASASGLDALTRFFSNFNGADFDLAIVVVMHLSPDHKSELASILEKRCRWPVHLLEKDTQPEPQHVYVTPADRNVIFKNKKIVLQPLPEQYLSAPSIDEFLISLANTKKKKSIGIILSGFGKDGSEGIKAIRENHGYTLAQLPATTEHKDMPSSAIRTGAVDSIVPAEQMFYEINHFVNNHSMVNRSLGKKSSLDSIFELLEMRSGTNFSQYKQTTIQRRIDQRMKVLKVNTLDAYYEVIQRMPQELDKLFSSVLIGVTEFFRDKEAFDSLKKQLSTLLDQKNPGDDIRIWSVGCATGEEPFSINILVHELLGAKASLFNLQIFASDLDEKALNQGRKGIYHKDSLSNIPARYISKYFDSAGEDHFEFRKSYRQYVLFNRHDISNDPPFVKLDLVICRNLLIYFNNALQKQVLQVFHYALNSNGILFLGKSESVSLAQDLYTKTKAAKVFKKADASLDYRLQFSKFRSKKDVDGWSRRKNKERNLTFLEVAKETLYNKYEYPFVMVDNEGTIKEVHGSLRLYLEIGKGAMNADLYKMLNPELVTPVKALHTQVKKTKITHSSSSIRFSVFDMDHQVVVKIVPFIYPVNQIQYYLVIFQKVELPPPSFKVTPSLTDEQAKDKHVRELEDELRITKEHLRIFTEELEATNQELQSINEEVQSANEELKSSNEELETSNEELQSTNEELNTANNELRLSNEALIQKEEELKEAKRTSEQNEMIFKAISDNIPNGTVGILNEKFEIQFVGGHGLRRHEFIVEDLKGRILPEMNPSETERKKLYKVFRSTLKGNDENAEFSFKERYFDLQTVPITLPGDDENMIMYLTQDITEQKKSALKLQMALDATDLIIYEYNYKKKVFLPNKRFAEFFEFNPEEEITAEMVLEKLHPEDRKERDLKNELALKTGSLQYETRVLLSKETKWIRIYGRILFDEDGKPESGVASLLDITKDKQLLLDLKLSEQKFRLIADSAPVMIWMTNASRGGSYFNPMWLNFTGRRIEEEIGGGWKDGMHPDDRDLYEKIYTAAWEERKTFTHEYQLRRHDGQYRWVLDHGIPTFDAEGNFTGYLGSCVDITGQKEFTASLEKEVADRTRELEKSNNELINLNVNLEEYAYAASHDLQEPLRKIQIFLSIVKDNLENTEKIEVYLEKIENSAERMRNLVKDILEYNTLNKSSERFTLVDLDILIQEIREDFEVYINDQDGSITNESMGQVMGVKSKIYQLFSNLIKNALTYTSGKPEIRITVSECQQEDFKPGETDLVAGIKYKCIAIEDNGIGFEMKNLERILKPFNRLHSNNEYPGTGLGLAICTKILEMHQGFLQVSSKKGSGSTFKVYFPIEHIK